MALHQSIEKKKLIRIPWDPFWVPKSFKALNFIAFGPKGGPKGVPVQEGTY